MFTTNKFTEYVNQALNYPAISFDDIRLFLDQAISEINTELHTSIIHIDEMENKAKQEVEKLPNLVILQASDLGVPITSSSTEPVSDFPKVYYNTTSKLYYIYNTEAASYTVGHPYLIGVYLNNGTPTYYKTGNVLASDVKYWYLDKFTSPVDVDLEDYFTTDWITLFLVPYVCYKYSIRDGDTGRLFNEEFSQGFSQLRKSYNVPFQVILSTVAHLFAYRDDVTHHLPRLNIWTRTRAITANMKNPSVVNIRSNTFYDRGGFGV